MKITITVEGHNSDSPNRRASRSVTSSEAIPIGRLNQHSICSAIQRTLIQSTEIIFRPIQPG